MPGLASSITRQFLLGCLRAALAGEGTSPAPAPAEAVDWTLFIQLAVFHRLVPLLERALREYHSDERSACPERSPWQVWMKGGKLALK
jgi:hypothetical protein